MLVADLKAAATDLHAVPVNREGGLWLSHLRDPAQRGFWDAARSRVARLSDRQRAGLALRHLPILLCLDDATLGKDRAVLLADLKRRLAEQKHHVISPTYDGQSSDYPQRLSVVQDQLCWADLAAMALLFHAVREPQVVTELFRQADHDHQDTSTEHGGVLAKGDSGFRAQGYSPMMRRHDLKFYPPPEMIKHLYTAPAHYHFHAQHEKNSHYAGPGLGDRNFSDRLNFQCLVLTFIDRDRLNVDYYQPGGAVVDMGVIHR